MFLNFLKKYILLLTAALIVTVTGIFCFFSATNLDLISGFSHPLEGWDHIVTMLGVGIWAAQLRGKAIWLLPTTFVSVMSFGGISGAAKYLAVPSAEILILLSCLVFSALITQKIKFDTRINVLIVAFFAFFHGYAHGQEISASASLISYTLGFMTATLLLHGAGILVAKVVLLVIAFFVAQTLNVIASTEAAKTVTASYSQLTQNDFQQIETKSIDKSPLINTLPQWLNLSPPLESILRFFSFIKTYFVLCTLLLVFSVSQFVCYVFYIKQRCNFVCPSTFLAPCFKKFFALPLTLSAFQLSYFYLQKTLAVKAGFFAFNIFTFKSMEIFMKTCFFKNVRFLWLSIFLLLPHFAYAHSLHEMQISFFSGFLHPLQGFDHVVAMLAVGFWAMQLRDKSIWLLPFTFVSIMVLGGLLAISNISINYAEIIILVSGFVLSVLAIKNVQFDLKINVLIVGFFALFHGFAHGQEISESAGFLGYSVGFITATAFLHLTGIMSAYFLNLARRIMPHD